MDPASPTFPPSPSPETSLVFLDEDVSSPVAFGVDSSQSRDLEWSPEAQEDRRAESASSPSELQALEFDAIDADIVFDGGGDGSFGPGLPETSDLDDIGFDHQPSPVAVISSPTAPRSPVASARAIGEAVENSFDLSLVEASLEASIEAAVEASPRMSAAEGARARAPGQASPGHKNLRSLPADGVGDAPFPADSRRKRRDPTRSPAPPAKQPVPRSSQAAFFRDESSRARDELSSSGLLQRSQAGTVTALADIERAKRDKAVARLCAVLPEEGLAHLVLLSVEKLQKLEPADILRKAQSRATTGHQGKKPWSAARINEAANAVEHLYEDLDQHGIEHDGFNFSPGDVKDHLDRFTEARGEIFERRSQGGAAAAGPAHSVGQPAAADGPRRVGSKPQTGFSCGANRRRGLLAAEEWCGLKLGMSEVFPAQMPGAYRSQRVPSEAFTIGIVARLETFCADPASDPVLAHIAAGMLFCTFACLRFQQAQYCWLTGLRDGEIFEGFVFLEKDPVPSRMQPRPFWGFLQGLTHGRAWFDRWWASIQDLPACNFVFRDVVRDKDSGKFAKWKPGPDGKPIWLNSPIDPGQRLIAAVREVLVTVCGLSEEQAAAFGQHSARRTLTEIGDCAQEPPTCRNEIGRWSGSVAKLQSMRPTRDVLWLRHVARVSKMPDLYAEVQSELRPLVVLLRVRAYMCSALQTLGGASHVPLWGGWEAIPKFRPTGTGYDD